MEKKLQSVNLLSPSRTVLRLGFVPLTDCAPLVMARELNLFKKFGLNVALSRELGWATIRDKVIHRELHAAHAVVGMPFAATLGLGSIPCDCLTGLILNLHGNAITLSDDLWNRGVRDGESFRTEVANHRGRKIFTFGVVYRFSSHNFLLRRWLEAAGLQPERDVRIVVVPPPQMVANLKAGHLDGFCAGEPWNSAAVQSRAGWCVATSAELDPGHPEKVLMVRREFADQHQSEHLALIAALLEACVFCDDPANREQLIATLARPEYVGTPEATLRPGILGPFNFGHGHERLVADFNVFHQHGANEPSADKASWVLQHLRHSRLAREGDAPNAGLRRRVFRPDIFEKAVRLTRSTPISNKNESISESTVTSV